MVFKSSADVRNQFPLCSQEAKIKTAGTCAHQRGDTTVSFEGHLPSYIYRWSRSPDTRLHMPVRIIVLALCSIHTDLIGLDNLTVISIVR